MSDSNWHTISIRGDELPSLEEVERRLAEHVELSEQDADEHGNPVSLLTVSGWDSYILEEVGAFAEELTRDYPVTVTLRVEYTTEGPSEEEYVWRGGAAVPDEYRSSRLVSARMDTLVKEAREALAAYDTRGGFTPPAGGIRGALAALLQEWGRA